MWENTLLFTGTAGLVLFAIGMFAAARREKPSLTFGLLVLSLVFFLTASFGSIGLEHVACTQDGTTCTEHVLPSTPLASLFLGLLFLNLMYLFAYAMEYWTLIRRNYWGD